MQARLRKLLLSAGLRNVELSVLFVGEKAMRSLNRRYRGKDRPTDVLSFSFREGFSPKVQSWILGDIVISMPTAVRQARSLGVPVAKELDRLLVHGLLHLLGYDHERNEAEERRMRAAETRLLNRLGQ